MVVAGIAIAGLAIGRADAVAKLRDLQGGPVKFRQRGNQTCNHAGFTYAPRMPANHHNCHAAIFAGFICFKNPKNRVDRDNSFFTQWPTIEL